MLFISIIILLTASALQSIKITPQQYSRCASLIFLTTGVLAANTLDVPAMGPGLSLFNGRLQATPMTQAIGIFLNFISFIIVGFVWAPGTYQSPVNWINTSAPPISEYSTILIFTTLGGIILISSTNFVTLYLGVELQSFAIYILASLYSGSETSTGAALKYFFIGGLASAIILIGRAIVYWQTGTIDLWHVINLVNQMSQSQMIESEILQSLEPGIWLGLVAIIVGILIKIAAAPFHFWSPDVYDGVPNVVTTWLTIIPKISLFGFILHLSSNLSNSDIIESSWTTILVTASMLSIIIGTIVGLVQVRVKRLLAYSTISHVGFILLALSINTEWGIEAFIFYLVQYTITTLDTFLILLALSYCLNKKNQEYISDIEEIKDISGQFYVNPVLGLGFSVCLFSITGVPPLVGFFGKQAVLSAAIQSDYNFLALVGIVTSVISATYYLNLIKTIHFTSPILFNQFPLWISNRHSYIIATITLIVTLFILTPTIILDSTNILAFVINST